MILHDRIRRLRRRVRARVRLVLRAHTAPGRLAAAMLVGALVGTSPLYGLHLALCVGLAWLLRLNQAAVYGAANVSIPPLSPLLGFASVQLGERLLHGRWVALSVGEFRHAGVLALARRFFVDWLAGGVLVGAAIGLVLAALVYPLSRARQQRRADPILRAIARASRRYRRAPAKLRWYAFFKYRMDPCYRRIAALVPPSSETVDLGTGLGMLPVVLALLGDGRRALGVDWDAPKLAAGRLAAAGLPSVELEHGDARTHALPPCDVVTLVDVLHYYDADAQRDLLARAAAALRPGGAILVREGDAALQRGARWTRFVEALAVKLGWNRGPTTRFRAIDALRADLEALGFTVRDDEASGRLHPGNRLLVARRAAVTARDGAG